MCYSFFFSLLIFCYRAYWSVNPWGTCFTWSHPHRVAFQFNQEPLWLLKYRHLSFSRFVSLCQITHESKTSSGLKDPRHHPQYIGAGHAFLSFIPSTWNSNLKILATTSLQQIHGTVNSSIELLLTVCPKTIRNTTWMNLCPNLESAHDSLENRNLKKSISNSTKT